MASLEVYFKPNRLPVSDSYSTDTAFHIVATDGTGYSSLANLIAAGKKPFPSLDPGMFANLVLKSWSNAGADGSAFYYQVNPQGSTANPTPPTTATATPIDGSIYYTTPDMYVNQLWIAKGATTDTIRIVAQY